jgi:hypothetical protein
MAELGRLRGGRFFAVDDDRQVAGLAQAMRDELPDRLEADPDHVSRETIELLRLID